MSWCNQSQVPVPIDGGWRFYICSVVYICDTCASNELRTVWYQCMTDSGPCISKSKSSPRIVRQRVVVVMLM